MIFGNVGQSREMIALLPAPLQKAIKLLAETDFGQKTLGRHDVDGDDLFYLVQEVTTKAVAETRPEVHRAYVDIQFLCRGRERIGFAVDTGRNKVGEDLLADKDLLFYQGAENESAVTLKPGDFAVFFPSDVHRPVCQVDGPETIRKVVFKVRVATLGAQR